MVRESQDNPVDGQTDTDGQAAFMTEGDQSLKGTVGPAGKHPPWTDLKTKAGKDRRRLPLACIICRRKKIRCSGEKPACSHCLKSRIPCLYKVTARRAAPRTDYVAIMDKRLKRMEDRIIRMVDSDEAKDPPRFERASLEPRALAQDLQVKGTKRTADESFTDVIDICARPRGTEGHQQLVKIDQSSRGDACPLREGEESLPAKDIALHLANVFFDCLYGQTFHVLHKPTFMRDLQAGTAPPVLILAICAVSARFSTHPQISSEPAFLRGDEWAAAARTIARAHYDEPSITLTTVMLLLGLHEFGACQGGRCWASAGVAIRMAYALHLNKDFGHHALRRNATEELSVTDKELRRRVMWACYFMDRFNSSGTEMPAWIDEDAVSTRLPIKEDLFLMEVDRPTETLDAQVVGTSTSDTGQSPDLSENMGVAAYMVRAVALWGRVVKYLNLGGKEKDPYPIWSPRSGFVMLQRQLERFTESLPHSLQYSTQNLQAHATEGLACQLFFLHVVIHQNRLYMSRFGIPSVSNSLLLKDAPQHFRSHLLQTALDSAGKISSVIGDSLSYFLVVPFVGYCAYVSSTIHIFGIFCNSREIASASKNNLTYNLRYINRMKRYWGLLQHLWQDLQEMYAQYKNAAVRGDQGLFDGSRLLPYGSWFNRAPPEASTPGPDAALRDATRGEAHGPILSPKLLSRRAGSVTVQPSLLNASGTIQGKDNRPKASMNRRDGPTLAIDSPSSCLDACIPSFSFAPPNIPSAISQRPLSLHNPTHATSPWCGAHGESFQLNAPAIHLPRNQQSHFSSNPHTRQTLTSRLLPGPGGAYPHSYRGQSRFLPCESYNDTGHDSPPTAALTDPIANIVWEPDMTGLQLQQQLYQRLEHPCLQNLQPPESLSMPSSAWFLPFNTSPPEDRPPGDALQGEQGEFGIFDVRNENGNGNGYMAAAPTGSYHFNNSQGPHDGAGIGSGV
ncbi:MAG: hypothetical protein M1817_004767 [Caeruleum heppii]|nr:MAG: hypothetical protein M1817_004767 [Caeruleum heppii]